MLELKRTHEQYEGVRTAGMTPRTSARGACASFGTKRVCGSRCSSLGSVSWSASMSWSGCRFIAGSACSRASSYGQLSVRRIRSSCQPSRGQEGDQIMADFTPEELLKKLKLGAKIERADLRGIQLEKAVLDGAILRRCDLEGANLESAKLRRANLKNCSLREAFLAGRGSFGGQSRQCGSRGSQFGAGQSHGGEPQPRQPGRGQSDRRQTNRREAQLRAASGGLVGRGRSLGSQCFA